MQTRKLIAPIDLKKPDRNIRDFAYPAFIDNTWHLVGFNSGKIWQYGMIVFIGTAVTENDLFARIVDSGRKIESVRALLESLVELSIQVNNFKIGNVVEVIAKEEGGFEIIKKTDSLSTFKKVISNTP